MRRWRTRVAVLAIGGTIAVASAPTLSAWTATTSNPSGTLTADADWTPPVIHRAVIQKTEGGKPNHVRAGGNYRLCAQVATTDTGNPAAGIPVGDGWVQTSLTNLTSSLTNPINLGTTTAAPCLGTDNRLDIQRTVTAGTPEGTRQVTLSVRDNDNNTRTNTIGVTVDNTRPTALSFAGVNKPGGTAGLLENGDKAVFTFNDEIEPNVILPGWDGTDTPVTLAVIHSTSTPDLDRLSVYRFNTSTQIPLTRISAPNYVALKADYIPSGGAGYTVINSTMTAVGDAIEITLGTPSPLDTGAVTSTTPTTWNLQGSIYDLAGNTLSSSAAVTEPAGDVDIEF